VLQHAPAVVRAERRDPIDPGSRRSPIYLGLGKAGPDFLRTDKPAKSGRSAGNLLGANAWRLTRCGEEGLSLSRNNRGVVPSSSEETIR
jgi:hypothetical protein